jgi:hypothetical protein
MTRARTLNPIRNPIPLPVRTVVHTNESDAWNDLHGKGILAALDATFDSVESDSVESDFFSAADQ